MNETLVELILWETALCISAIFQFWRKADADGLIFLLMMLALVLQSSNRWTHLFLGLKKNAVQLKKFVYIGICGILIFTKPHSQISTVMIFLLLALLLLSPDSSSRSVEKNTALFRGRWLWITVAIATAVWELINYFWGYFENSENGFPTISMLVDPLVSSTSGRLLFFLFFGPIGYFFLFWHGGEDAHLN